MMGKADFLISGDGNLLSLADRFACPIVTPDEFIKHFPL
jgi:predicted nucleic acid-binding protein